MFVTAGSHITLNDQELLWVATLFQGSGPQSDKERDFRADFTKHFDGAPYRVHLGQIAKQRHAIRQAAISVKEAARILEVGPATVRKRLRTGTLRGYQMNGRWLVDGSALRTEPSG